LVQTVGVDACVGEDAQEAQRLAALRKLLQAQIAQQIAGQQRLYQDDPKYQLGNTLEKVLEQTRPGVYLPLRRTAPLLLHQWPNEDQAGKALVGLLSEEDEYLAFNAAQSLAHRGGRQAIPLLRKVLGGEAAVTNSLFEHDRAALALLALGEKLPREFAWRNHPEFEKYTVRE